MWSLQEATWGRFWTTYIRQERTQPSLPQAQYGLPMCLYKQRAGREISTNNNLTYLVFFLVEDSSLMDWRRRNDNRDSNILRSLITSSRFRLGEESATGVVSSLLGWNNKKLFHHLSSPTTAVHTDGSEFINPVSFKPTTNSQQTQDHFFFQRHPLLAVGWLWWGHLFLLPPLRSF